MALSDVLNYFLKCVDDITKAQCTLCEKKISRGGLNSRDFTTSNFRLHLDKEHHSTYTQFKRKHNECHKSVDGADVSNIQIN